MAPLAVRPSGVSRPPLGGGEGSNVEIIFLVIDSDAVVVDDASSDILGSIVFVETIAAPPLYILIVLFVSNH